MGLSFNAAVELAGNSETLPGVKFVKVKDLRSHGNYRTVESLEKAVAALRAEGKVCPIRAGVMEEYCRAIEGVAEATRNGYYRVAINVTGQLVRRLRVYKSADGVRSRIPEACKHLLEHVRVQEAAGLAVKAHVGRTMERVSEYSKKKWCWWSAESTNAA